LIARVTAFESDMQSKQENAHMQRSELMSRLRPQAIKEAQILIQEADSTLKLQLLKFGKSGSSPKPSNLSSII
jgi:hypothetical protein